MIDLVFVNENQSFQGHISMLRLSLKPTLSILQAASIWVLYSFMILDLSRIMIHVADILHGEELLAAQCATPCIQPSTAIAHDLVISHTNASSVGSMGYIR